MSVPRRDDDAPIPESTGDPSNLDAFPDFDSVCGNGEVDSYEDCDDGTLNGPPPSPCSKTCRFNN